MDTIESLRKEVLELKDERRQLEPLAMLARAISEMEARNGRLLKLLVDAEMELEDTEAAAEEMIDMYEATLKALADGSASAAD